MKRILIVSSVSLFIYSCGSGIDEKKLSEYKVEVCTCASEAKNQKEWTECNEKRKNFFNEMDLGHDDATANTYNDQMYDCLSEYDKY
jgi:hypothetical protein